MVYMKNDVSYIFISKNTLNLLFAKWLFESRSLGNSTAFRFPSAVVTGFVLVVEYYQISTVIIYIDIYLDFTLALYVFSSVLASYNHFSLYVYEMET